MRTPLNAEYAFFLTIWLGVSGWMAWNQFRPIVDGVRSGSMRTGRTRGRTIYRTANPRVFRSTIIQKSVWAAVLVAVGVAPVLSWLLGK